MGPLLRKIVATLTVITVGFGLFTVGYMLGRSGVDLFGDQGEGFSAIREAYNRIRSSAVDPPSEDELARGAIRGMVEEVRKHGDPYAVFYGPQGYRAFQELTTGQFSGIGVRLDHRSGRFEILSVLPSTPAKEAGLKRGDVITHVNGRSLADVTTGEAVDTIKGPASTKVTLTIDRGGSTLEVTLTRATIALPTASARMLDDSVGYVRLYGFSRGAADDVRDKLDHLLARGADGVVFDLRDNPGGLFDEAVDVASVFIESGEIVTYKERDSEGRVYRASGNAYEDLPLVVLVNRGSASASEVVAGALQDRDRAELVGQTTYGKGAVQNVFPLFDGSAFKVTIALYLTPDGRDLSGQGVKPDTIVTRPAAQRKRAAELVRNLVVSLGEQG